VPEEKVLQLGRRDLLPFDFDELFNAVGYPAFVESANQSIVFALLT
jgi:hypothetical protein